MSAASRPIPVPEYSPLQKGGQRGAWSPNGDLPEGLRFRVTTRRQGNAPIRPGRGIASVRQVHGARIVPFRLASPRTEADGILLEKSGQAAMVRVADCAPVLLVARAPRRACLLHVGWRGLASGILEAGVRRLRAADAGDISAFIGPHIRVCCYSIGSAAAAALRRRPGPFSLEAEIRRRLRKAGVSGGAIYGGAPCTGCATRAGRPLFYSWRVRREKGRMAAVAALS